MSQLSHTDSPGLTLSHGNVSDIGQHFAWAGKVQPKSASVIFITNVN